MSSTSLPGLPASSLLTQDQTQAGGRHCCPQLLAPLLAPHASQLEQGRSGPGTPPTPGAAGDSVQQQWAREEVNERREGCVTEHRGKSNKDQVWVGGRNFSDLEITWLLLPWCVLPTPVMGGKLGLRMQPLL